MDLKDFVSETLLSIITGVTDAQEKAKEHGAHVNPAGPMRHITKTSENATWDNRTNLYAQVVSFDIAVTAEDTAQGGAKIEVLGFFGGDIGGEKSCKNAVASRVQFGVPILLPGQNIDDSNANKSDSNEEVFSKGVQP